jgi:hypothetical protein
MGCLTGLSRILHAYSLERKAEWGAIQAPWDLIPAHIADRHCLRHQWLNAAIRM